MPVQNAASSGCCTPVVEENKYITKVPIIGTFIESQPRQTYVCWGGNYNWKGDVLCVIEAMKLFNEIESEVSGKIVKNSWRYVTSRIWPTLFFSRSIITF
jgi:acetyl-CoA carboxylase biotin carboxyl carrier protein